MNANLYPPQSGGPINVGGQTLPRIDREYLINMLMKLLATPSPSGFTDNVVHLVCDELKKLGIEFELTRRGAIAATIHGRRKSPQRSLVAHLDTLGAMVREIKPNGRLALTPIGTWSSRFAEGARVTVFTDHGNHRGTILPLKASGHVYGDEVDEQPVNWDQLEVRIDERVFDADDLHSLGCNVGDFVGVDPQPEITAGGFIVSRHLDNKAGVACLLACAKVMMETEIKPAINCRLLFTIFEEVGSGASTNLHQDVAEMVSVDNATPAPGQCSTEFKTTIAMADSTGPFDYHLTHLLLRLAAEHNVEHVRDVFRYYRCDAASALEAGNDIRTALVSFGVDASHGYERTHIDSLVSLSRLLLAYMHSPPSVARDRVELGSIKGFPDQPNEAPPVPERQDDPAGTAARVASMASKPTPVRKNTNGRSPRNSK